MNPFRLAGITLVMTSLGFIAVFGYLASHFGYPEVLEGKAADVLPAFVAGGGKMRAVWAVYAILPAGIALAALLAFPLFRRAGEGLARLGRFAAITAAVAMTVGLARWPTLNYVLGRRFLAAGPVEQEHIASIFDAGNLYLGNVIGEFIGEVGLSSWFLTLSLAIVRGVGLWRWTGYLGLFTAVSMTVGAFRNLTSLVAPIAALNNNLLPIFLIALGTALIVPIGQPRSDARLAPTS